MKSPVEPFWLAVDLPAGDGRSAMHYSLSRWRSKEGWGTAIYDPGPRKEWKGKPMSIPCERGMQMVPQQHGTPPEAEAQRGQSGGAVSACAVAGVGSFADHMLRNRKAINTKHNNYSDAQIFEPVSVPPWQPRGDHFYDDLREEQPRKFAHKGVHARYGGPVACHSQEKVEAVHCDEARVHERELIEHSGGRDADIYGANKDMESVLEKHRCKELKRGKNNIGAMASSKTQEGRWMEEFVSQGFFTSSPDKARLGHEALGYATGKAGFWGPPPPKREFKTAAARGLHAHDVTFELPLVRATPFPPRESQIQRLRW